MMSVDDRQPRAWRELRLQAWALYQQGRRQYHIADHLGISRSAVSRWLRLAQEEGLERLNHERPRGPAPRLSSQQRAELVSLIERGADTYGFVEGRWTTRRVAALIWIAFGVSYHPAHVSGILRSLAWTTENPVAARPRGVPRPCRQCGRVCISRQLHRDLCATCYAYLLRHGSDRPLVREPRPAIPCINCGGLTQSRVRGRCRKCYARWWRAEQARARPAPGSEACRTCGRTTARLRRGLCPRCYMAAWRRDRRINYHT